MCLKLISFCLLVIFCRVNSLGSEQKVNVTEDVGKFDNDASADNSSYYSTREMRDMCLKEWAGRTQEVQGYFDQLPEETFKEDDETLKFMRYYENKGVKNVHSKQMYNITAPVRPSMGPEYTIEVNDSYVPKYRVSSSEEIRMEKYGSFHSPEDEFSDSTLKSTTETSVTTEPPDSEEKIPSGKKKKRRLKKPSDMDPKEKVKRKRKKGPIKDDKKKELVENKINNAESIDVKLKKGHVDNSHLQSPFILNNHKLLHVQGANMKQNKIEYEEAYRRHVIDVVNNKNDGDFNKINLGKRFKEESQMKTNPKKRKQTSIFNSFMTSCKLTHKHKNHRNLSQPRRRSRQQYSLHPQPFL